MHPRVFVLICLVVALIPEALAGAHIADPNDIYDKAYRNLLNTQDIITPMSVETVGYFVNQQTNMKKMPHIFFRALVIATAWGNLESLDILRNRLKKLKKLAVSDGRGAHLGDIMHYLYVKKAQEKEDAKKFLKYLDDANMETEYVTRENEVYILDTITLRRLESESNPEFRNHVQKHADRFKFVIPYGWTGGINMFTPPKDFGNRIVQFGKVFMKEYHRCDDTHKFDCAVDAVFKAPVLKRLRAAVPGISERNIYWVHGKEGVHLRPGVQVYQNMKPRLPSADDLRRFAKVVRPCVDVALPGEEQRHLTDAEKDAEVMKFFSKYQMIRTLPAMMEIARTLLDKIKETGFDYDLVVIPERGKSTAIVVHALFSLDESMDASKIVHFTEKEGYDAPENSLKLLIVDDLALSGKQLAEWTIGYNALPPVSRALTAALIASPIAVERFRAENLEVISGQQMAATPPPRFFMDMPGFAGGREMVATSWMSPDNNFRTFIQLIAPTVTFHGKGVKYYYKEWEMPDCNKEWDEDQIRRRMRKLGFQTSESVDAGDGVVVQEPEPANDVGEVGTPMVGHVDPPIGEDNEMGDAVSRPVRDEVGIDEPDTPSVGSHDTDEPSGDDEPEPEHPFLRAGLYG